MSNDHQIAENMGAFLGQSLPFWPLWILVSDSRLKDVNRAWFIAVLIVLGAECGIMVVDWIKPKRTSSESPNVWFDRLADAVARAGLVIYFFVAVFHVDSSYFAALRTSIAHFDFSSTAVWVPCLLWAILLANAVYAIPMGVRYSVGPHQPGDIIGAKISAALWIAGAAVLLWFHSFTPQPFVVEQWVLGFLSVLFSPFLLWPADPAAAHFVVTWFYLGVLLRQATKLAILLRGEGGAARDRAREQEEQEREHRRWPTGNA